MADTHRAPIKLRVTRPYDSEDAFIEGDLLRIGRGSIVLPDTPALPVGRAVRFDVLLSTGAAVFRGEGTVLAHHNKGGFKPEGLEVRITRLDVKSKAVLERAQAFRVAHKSAKLPGHRAADPHDATPHHEPEIVHHDPEPEAARPEPARLDQESGVRPAPTAGHIDPPPNREEILGRLRARAARMREAGGLHYETPKR